MTANAQHKLGELDLEARHLIFINYVHLKGQIIIYKIIAVACILYNEKIQINKSQYIDTKYIGKRIEENVI